MSRLPGPPNSSIEIGFTWFSWFRKLYNETLGYFKTDGSRGITGDITITGTGRKFLADMSNATTSLRYTWQTSTVNGNTLPQFIPNGTATITAISAFNKSDPDNGSFLSLQARSTDTRLLSSKVGTGTDLPIQFWVAGVERGGIETDGRIYGTGLHNNGTVTGTTKQYFASGTYTPSYTNVANTSAGTPGKCQWTRLGNVVTVTGRSLLTITSATTATTVVLTLPIASNLAATADLNGVVVSADVAQAIHGGTITADTTNDKASLSFRSGSGTGSQNYSFTFQYEIL